MKTSEKRKAVFAEAQRLYRLQKESGEQAQTHDEILGNIARLFGLAGGKAFCSGPIDADKLYSSQVAASLAGQI